MSDTTHNLQIKTSVKDLASGELKKLGSTGKTAGASIAAGFVKAQLALGALKLAIRGVASVIKGLTTDFADNADRTAKLARQLGVSVERLSEMGHVAKFSGTDIEAVANSVRFLQRAMSEAATRGTPTYLDAFKQIGLTTQDLARLMAGDGVDAFREIGERIAKLPTQANRTAVAMALMSRSAAAMFPIFDEGAGVLAKLIEQVRRYGGTLTATQAKIAEEFSDARDALNMALDGVKKSIAVSLMPTITKALNKLSDWVADNREKIVGFFMQLADAMIVLAEATVRGVRALVRAYTVIAEGSTEARYKNDSLFDSMIAGLEKARAALARFQTEREASAGGAGLPGVTPFSLGPTQAQPLANLPKYQPAGDISGMLQGMRERLALLGATTERERELLQIEFDRQGAIRDLMSVERLSTADMEEAIRLIDVLAVRRRQALEEQPGTPTFLDGIRRGLAALREQLTPENIGLTVVQSATQAWTGFFDAITFGSAKASDAFRSMASNMLRQLAQLANQQLLLELLSAVGLNVAGAGAGARGGTPAPTGGIR